MCGVKYVNHCAFEWVTKSKHYTRKLVKKGDETHENIFFKKKMFHLCIFKGDKTHHRPENNLLRTWERV